MSSGHTVKKWLVAVVKSKVFHTKFQAVSVVPSSGWPCHEELEKVPFVTNKIDHMLVDLISGTVTLCPFHLPVACGNDFFTRRHKLSAYSLLFHTSHVVLNCFQKHIIIVLK